MMQFSSASYYFLTLMPSIPAYLVLVHLQPVSLP